MVSNDDVMLNTPKNRIGKIYQEVTPSAPGTMVYHTFSVPSDKIWSLLQVSGDYDTGSETVIFIRDPSSDVIYLSIQAGEKTAYAPPQPILLDYGWDVQVRFKTTVGDNCDSWILVEEYNKV